MDNKEKNELNNRSNNAENKSRTVLVMKFNESSQITPCKIGKKHNKIHVAILFDY